MTSKFPGYSISKKKLTILKELERKYGLICWYCGIDLEESIHIDHIVPKSKGGSDDLYNLALSCGMCNRAKLAYNVNYFLKWLSHLRSSQFQCCYIKELDFNKKDCIEDCDWDRLQKSFA